MPVSASSSIGRPAFASAAALALLLAAASVQARPGAAPEPAFPPASPAESQRGRVGPETSFRVHVFVGMKGHVHNSYRHINRVWDALAARHGIAFDTSNNGRVFHPDSLKRYRAVVLNNNTHIGNVLNASQKAAFFGWARTHEGAVRPVPDLPGRADGGVPGRLGDAVGGAVGPPERDLALELTTAEGPARSRLRIP